MSGPAAPADTGECARCFLSLLPDSNSRDALLGCRQALEMSRNGAARGIRWLDAASLHLTLRFLGDSTRAQVEFFKHMLPALARPLPGSGARRCAIWPNRARPRLLVLELDAPGELVALAQASEGLARKAGFAPEPRPFRAHLTLARLRPGCALHIPSVPLPTLAFESLSLMRSELQATGSRYQALACVPLSGSPHS